jgi:GT2 family glycosyltransferase
MTPGKKLSIIIVNWNAGGLICDCLKSVYDTVKMPFEVIVVDNNSSDGSAELIAGKFPAVILIKQNINMGFPKANNMGFTCSSGDFLLFLNPDTVLLGDAVDAMVGFLETRPDVGILGPKIVDKNNNVSTATKAKLPSIPQDFLNLFLIQRMLGRVSGYVAARYPSLVKNRHAYHDLGGDCEFLSGCCLLMRREFFETLGGFDEILPMYMDDIDLCCRSLKSGKTNVYFPKAVIMHVGQATVKKADNYKLHGVLGLQSELFYYRKHFGARRVLSYKLIVMFNMPYRLLLDIITLPYFLLLGRFKERAWVIKNHLMYFDLLVDRRIEGVLK